MTCSTRSGARREANGRWCALLLRLAQAHEDAAEQAVRAGLAIAHAVGGVQALTANTLRPASALPGRGLPARGRCGNAALAP